jgi:hypothetical protein
VHVQIVTSPPRFTEGLAVYVSDGGGIVDFLFPRYGIHWDLKPKMFYRQASLFVSFINAYDKNAVGNLLMTMQSGESFDASFRHTYDIPISTTWQLFLKHLKSEVDHEKTAKHLPQGIENQSAQNPKRNGQDGKPIF